VKSKKRSFPSEVLLHLLAFGDDGKTPLFTQMLDVEKT